MKDGVVVNLFLCATKKQILPSSPRLEAGLMCVWVGTGSTFGACRPLSC